MRTRVGLALSLVALLGACVATGAKVTEDQLTQFQRGTTTVDQAVRALGPPTSSVLLPTGDRMLMWTYVQAQARPASFIPIIGPLVGGADAKSNSATLMFDSKGVLKTYSASASAYGSGTGLASGTSYAPTPQQPRQTPAQ